MIGESDETNPDHSTSTKNVKKNRKRKKKLYKTIREQMEFYFSDSNLSKDKFMKEIIGQSEDGFIDLEVFSTFNKIKSLTQEVGEIAQALYLSSELLELNEDHTKVRRTSPVRPRDDVDDCTIYVEHLPKDVDHAWLKRIFSSYGQVTYVSLPKFKISLQPKGFAFVEFDTPTAAKRACEHLGSLSEECVRAMSVPRPSEQLHGMKHVSSDDNSEGEHKELSSKSLTEPTEQASKDESAVNFVEPSSDSHIAKIPKKRKLEPESAVPFKKRPHTTGTDDENSGIVKSSKIKEVTQTDTSLDDRALSPTRSTASDELTERKSSKKRRLNEESEALELPCKKTRVDASEDDKGIDSSAAIAQVSDGATEANDVNNTLSSSADESHRVTTSEMKSEKKKRKRQKKSKAKMEQETLQLRVLSKLEWKRLKNRYLALQKANMSNLKRTLGCAVDQESAAGMKEEYSGASPRAKPIPEPIAPTKKIEFQAKVVVKLTLDCPVSNPKAVIEKIKSNNGIGYVEAKIGQRKIFVRCDSPQYAQDFMESDFVSTFQDAALLEGEEEVLYWEKLLKDREESRQRTSKVKVRGREKLLARADKAVEKSRHIYFDD